MAKHRLTGVEPVDPELSVVGVGLAEAVLGVAFAGLSSVLLITGSGPLAVDNRLRDGIRAHERDAAGGDGVEP